MMPKFNPKETPDRPPEVPAGTYLIALVYFEHKVGTSSGNDYINAKWRVVNGQHKGGEFYSMLGLDFSKLGNQITWSIMAESVGMEDTCELGAKTEGTEAEGRANIIRWFLNRVYKADVTIKESGGYRNHNMRLQSPERWSQAEQAFAKQYHEQNGGDSALPDPGAGDDPYQSEGYDEGATGGFRTDDDIPF